MSETTSQSQPLRPYGGVPAAKRIAGRRARLLAAGRELFGTQGIAATTVKGTCEAAGLSQRYFYESFRSVEELALAVLDSIAQEATQEVLNAVAVKAAEDWESRARAAFGALVAYVTADPAAGRIMSIETAGNGAKLAAWRRNLMLFGASVLESWMPTPDAADKDQRVEREIASLAIAGGVIEVFVAWLEGSVTATRQQLIAALSRTVTSNAGPAANGD